VHLGKSFFINLKNSIAGNWAEREKDEGHAQKPIRPARRIVLKPGK
jgi:hypothetical protein